MRPPNLSLSPSSSFFLPPPLRRRSQPQHQRRRHRHNVSRLVPTTTANTNTNNNSHPMKKRTKMIRPGSLPSRVTVARHQPSATAASKPASLSRRDDVLIRRRKRRSRVPPPARQRWRTQAERRRGTEVGRGATHLNAVCTTAVEVRSRRKRCATVARRRQAKLEKRRCTSEEYGWWSEE